ncbi:MAG TPA: c-type cytochrome domain-containing protein [Planctomycetota bacterium]|nr:c-type cytochrome domain-containing protein [Planctomycetota bacterium]
MNRCLLVLAFLFGLLGTELAAQEPPKEPAKDPTKEAAERLQQLLRELRAIDAATWTARLAALETQAKARDAEATTLRQQSKELEQRAAVADTEAKALRTEMARIQELQKLLATLPATNPAPGDAPKPAAEPPKMQPNAPAPAPDAGKTAPPKVEPKEAAAPAASMTPGGKDHGEIVTWARVSTIFADHCTSCHDPAEQKGGLDLTTFASARNGGGSGQSIVAGAPDQSRLYRMVTQQERPFMPRNADPLGKEQLALLRTWIEQGAADDAASAKTFMAEQATAAKATAVAVEATASADANALPMPEAIPQLALRTPMRPGPVASLARSPRAPLLALPGMQQVLLCNTDLQRIAVLPCALLRIGPVVFAEDGSLVLAAGGEPGQRGVAVLFDVRTGTVLATCGSERDVPLAAAVHKTAGLVALGGSSKHVRVYRIADGQQVLAGKHDDFVLSVAFAPDGRWVAAGDRAGTVQVWEINGGRVFQTLQGHQGAVHALAFDRSGASLLTAGADGTVRLWDVAEAKERWRQNAHPNQQALAVSFGPGDAVASCGSDGVIQVFTASGSPVATSKAAGEWLYAVAFGADDGVVFAGDWQGRVHRFDVKQKQLTATVPLAQAQ